MVSAPTAVSPLEVAAFCEVTVNGTGVVDVELDYLPHVVACENGAANDEALRAQAVAARSYLYYRLSTGDGTIDDGTGDQVYSCSNQPTDRHYAAVATTSGEVLAYEQTLIAGFYVAGSVPTAEDCVALPGDDDYSSTERFVTYNWETSGDGLEQTTLGWVNPQNWANRGCKSQNGAHCLAEQGWVYEDILRFFYGTDIEHVVAAGDCTAETGLPHGCGLVVEGEVSIFDDEDACFIKGCAGGPAWVDSADGWGSGSLMTGGFDSEVRDCFGRWNLSFTGPGTWAVDVHVPDGEPRVTTVGYWVRHAGEDVEVVIDQSASSGWVTLGEFAFETGAFQWVELSDLATESGDLEDGPFVVFDAVRVRDVAVPIDAPEDDPPADGGVEDAEDAGPVDPDSINGPVAREQPPDDSPGVDGGLPPGCACGASSSEDPLPALALATLLGLVWLRRRRVVAGG